MVFRLYYTFIVLSNARLTTGLWILYLLDRGFSLLEIGLVESVFHLTVLAAEVPTGYLADRLGRRLSLALGLLSSMAGTLLIFWAPSLLWLLPAFVFSALSWVFPSGADRAILYEMNVRLGRKDDYQRLAGQGWGYMALASAGGLFVGGLLALSSYELAFYGEVALTLLAFLPLAGLPEPSHMTEGPVREEAQEEQEAQEAQEAQEEQEEPVAATAGQSMAKAPAKSRFLHLLRHPVVARLLLFGTAYGAGVNLYHLLGQPLLELRGAVPGLVSIILGFVDLTASVGSFTSAGLATRFGSRRLLFLLPFALGAFALLLPSAPLVGAAALFLVLALGEGIVDPLLDNALNEELPDDRRATVLSTHSAMSSTIVAVGFPLVGWLAESQGYGWAYVPSVLLLALAPWGLGWTMQSRAADPKERRSVPAED